MAEKKGFWARLFGGGGCDCGMSIEEEKIDNKKSTQKKGCCCDMQIMEDPSCSCREAGYIQAESDCDCGTSEEKNNSVINFDHCCGDK